MGIVLDGVPEALREEVRIALGPFVRRNEHAIIRVSLTPAGWQVTVAPEGPSLLPSFAYDDLGDVMATTLNVAIPRGR